VIIIKRHYEPWPGIPAPGVFWGRLGALTATPTAVPGLMRRELLDPANPAFDFNISHMEFGRCRARPDRDSHEEHGLYMTSGGGLYHLDGDELEVRGDDFIYMAPYCRQGFRAGPEGGSYLLYKDVYRDGFLTDRRRSGLGYGLRGRRLRADAQNSQARCPAAPSRAP